MKSSISKSLLIVSVLTFHALLGQINTGYAGAAFSSNRGELRDLRCAQIIRENVEFGLTINQLQNRRHLLNGYTCGEIADNTARLRRYETQYLNNEEFSCPMVLELPNGPQSTSFNKAVLQGHCLNWANVLLAMSHELGC